MCEIFNKIMGKTLANKTKTHFFQPKTLNLYFKNSVNPKLKIINIVNLSAVSFELDESSDSKFVINAIISSFNNESIKLEVAEFDLKENAINALEEIRVKLYMPTKTLSKWLLLILLSIVSVYAIGNLASKISEVSSGFLYKSASANVEVDKSSDVQQPINQGLPIMENNNNNQVQPASSPAEIQSLIDQLEQIKQMQEGAAETPQQQQETILTDGDKLLKGLN